MNDDLFLRLQSLEHQVRVLTEENAQLAERAEDSLLLGLIAENIQHLQDKIDIFGSGLEQISILKGIPFCSCGRLKGSGIEKIASYVSFSDSMDLGYPIEIGSDLLAELKFGPVLTTDFQDLRCSFTSSDFRPTAAALVPFNAQNIDNGVFIFVDNIAGSERFAPMLMLLNHAVDMVVSKYDNIFLFDALQAANKHLEQRVQTRTIELSQANKAIKESELKYRELVENANDAIFVAQQGRLVFFNDKTLKDLKYSREELASLPLTELVHPMYRDLVTEYYHKRVSGDPDIPAQYTITVLNKDQDELTVQISSVVVDWNGKPATLNFGRDITDQRRLEERFHQAQKMEAIGQLASGIAHDFNNMLGGIMGAAEMLGFCLPDNARARKFHNMILAAAKRAASLTGQLLSFSRSKKEFSTPVDMHEVINEAILLLKNSIDPRVTVQANFEAPRCMVIGDPTQLQSVFLNLGINGAQAMPEGGTLSFFSDIKEIDSVYCHYSNFDIQPGNYLELVVQDTGTGIEPELLGKIFEPFFTTKEQGKGTGLGLASVYGTIKQHSGAITVSSTPGQGTVFHLLLPLTDAGVAEKLSSPILRKGSGRILVIDDDEAMRTTAKALLEELGYQVMVASNGQEGLEVYSRENAKFDLILLDMVMPVMNGRDCFQALRKQNPKARILLSSGFSKEEDLREMTEQGLLGLVRKPYTIGILSEAINGALKKRAPF